MKLILLKYIDESNRDNTDPVHYHPTDGHTGISIVLK